MRIMSWDNNWEKVYNNQNWGEYPPESLIRFIARNFYHKERKNIRLLEVGCGPGAQIWYMSRQGFDVYGIDGSSTAISIAKKRLKEENLKANLIVGDIIKLPFEDEFFDGIIDCECLYCNNWENSIKILSEIYRVLKKDGLFYSLTLTNEMDFGNSKGNNRLEYKKIEQGPFKDKGLIRLITRELIRDLYGRYFNIRSIDKMTVTQYNGKIKIYNWILICSKKH